MIITTLKKEHLKAAYELAFMNYQEERAAVKSLPEITVIPELTYFIENGFGVAALEGDKVLGFIGCWNPWDGAFDSIVKGTFTPIHAHGCIKENRAKIYERMYQKMAELLVSHGIMYHGIALYTHDIEAIKSYFHNGFGHRCTDAIRRMELISDIKPVEDISFSELPAGEVKQIRELRHELSNHMGESCCFMYSTEEEFKEWIQNRENSGNRIFVAKAKGQPIAFLEISDGTENFVTELSKMKNICGAFCVEEYRGNQIYPNLINYVAGVLKKEGYQYLGVDYESFNLTAQHFWPKYFEPYTYSVVRRIDESVLKRFCL